MPKSDCPTPDKIQYVAAVDGGMWAVLVPVGSREAVRDLFGNNTRFDNHTTVC